MAEIIGSICQMCNRFCGINVHIENDRIVKVEGMPEHFVSKGGLCPKGLAAIQYEYDPKRITQPLKRAGERGEGKWKQITWDEALSITAENLARIKNGTHKIKGHNNENIIFLSTTNPGNSIFYLWTRANR